MIDKAKRLVRRVDGWTLRHRSTRIVRDAVLGLFAHDVFQFAGAMAYFAVLSVFQLIVLSVVIGSWLLGEGAARELIITWVVEATPLDAETVASIIDGAIAAGIGVSLMSVALLLWASLGLFSALAGGMGRVFDSAPLRGFVKDKLIGLLLMAVIGALALASLLTGIVTSVLAAAADGLDADLPVAETGTWIIGLVAPAVLIFIAFWIIYRVVPNRPVTWREALWGAVTATIAWSVLRVGFTFYTTEIVNYENIYGPLAAGVTFLVFLYFGSVVVLVGAEVARATGREYAAARVAPHQPGPDAPRPVPPQAPRRGLPHAVILGAAALVGVLVGRWTKRDEY